MWASSIAASRLCAAETAWMSPVKGRLKSSIGTAWEYPPPAAPPLMPKVGPMEGWRSVLMVFRPNRFSAIPSPMAVEVQVVFGEPEPPRDLHHRQQDGFLGDLQIALHHGREWCNRAHTCPSSALVPPPPRPTRRGCPNAP